MLFQKINSRPKSVRPMYSAPVLRPQKRKIVSPVKGHLMMVDLIVGSIALYMMVDIGSVIYKQNKNKQEKDD